MHDGKSIFLSAFRSGLQKDLLPEQAALARLIRRASICLASTSLAIAIIVGSVYLFRRPENRAIQVSAGAAAQKPVPADLSTLVHCDLGVTNLVYEPVVPGVEYTKGTVVSPPLVYHVLKADLGMDGLRAGVLKPGASAAGAKQKITDMVNDAATESEEAVAAINADYFAFGVEGPWGIQLQDRNLYYTPAGKSALLVGEDGLPEIDIPSCRISVQFGDEPEWHNVIDLNRPSTAEIMPGLHLYGYTKEFANVSSLGGAAVIKAAQPVTGGTVTGVVGLVAAVGKTVMIPDGGLVLSCNTDDPHYPGPIFKEGDLVKIRTEMSPSAVDAVGGGPRIVRDGRASVEFEKETFSVSHAGYLRGRHPRSVVGISRDRKTLIMLVVVGRREASPGMTADEVARLAVELGAWDAMMFDGGGSAVMYTKKRMLLNKVQGRDLCNALAVFARKTGLVE
jgi:hypothetical protein